MQDVYQDGASHQLKEVLQDYYCLHMLLAPIKEKKVAHQAWIKVFTARDYPNIFPQSILIRALSLHLKAQPFNQL